MKGCGFVDVKGVWATESTQIIFQAEFVSYIVVCEVYSSPNLLYYHKNQSIFIQLRARFTSFFLRAETLKHF